MIEIEQHYKLTLSEEQGRQLYQLLLDAKDIVVKCGKMVKLGFNTVEEVK